MKARSRTVGEADGDEDLRLTAERIGYVFADLALLRQALAHASLPGAGRPCPSERLEFLGDAVLALAISELLFERHPQWSEGQLSRARAGSVRTASLADKAQRLGLDAALRMGRGEEKTGGRRKASILAAVYESTIGAVFLDGGYRQARALIQEHFACELRSESEGETDFKTALQEQVQATLGVTPKYHLVHTAGPDHARQFVVAVEIAGRLVAEGNGASKRAAEQQAASRALASPDWKMGDRPK